MGAGAGFAGSGALEAPPKLNDPIGAGVGLSAAAEVLPPAPKLKLPIGAGAGLSELCPKLIGAASVFGASIGLDVSDPKEKGVGAATTGVAVPELEPDLFPKKFGTSPCPDSLVGEVEAGGADGLPRPKLKAGLAEPPSEVEGLGGAKSDEGAAGTGVGAFDPEREKNPFSFGVTRDCAGVGAFVSGESGSATTEVAAKGDDARGRLEFRRESGPPVVRGTPRPEELDVDFSTAGAAGGGVDFAAGGAGAGTPKFPKLIPPKDGNEILVCCNSSISGRSSSLAEYLPPPLGDVAREPRAEAP